MTDRLPDAWVEPEDVSFTRVGGPIHLPSLTGEEYAELLDQLRPWVTALRARFVLDPRALPDCWEQHAGMVEALTALRDAERGAYLDSAPAGAAVEFLHAVRFVTGLLAEQTSVFGCAGPTHREPLTHLI